MRHQPRRFRSNAGASAACLARPSHSPNCATLIFGLGNRNSQIDKNVESVIPILDFKHNKIVHIELVALSYKSRSRSTPKIEPGTRKYFAGLLVHDQAAITAKHWLLWGANRKIPSLLQFMDPLKVQCSRH